MAVPAPTAPAHLPPLGAHERKEVGIQLQETLLELVGLSLVGKHLHWSVVGPHFVPVHEQLDELVDAWHLLADVVAERAVAIGCFPDGQATSVAAHDRRPPIEPGPVEDHAVIAELVHRIAEVGEETRRRMDRLGELDAASQDVLVDVVRELEKQLWMLRSQLARPATA
jgi:starvation-inducible DNA-binding protein